MGDNIDIRRIKIMEKDFWNYDGSFAFGDSMSPTFKHAAFVLFKRKRLPKKGDLVAYHSKGFDKDGSFNGKKGRVCHRCVDVQGEKYIIKGDNRNYVETIDKKDIEGAVVWCVKIW